MRSTKRLTAALLMCFVCACATQDTLQVTEASGEKSPASTKPEPTIQEVPIPDELLFDFLVAEFALRQGDYREALRRYEKLSLEVNDIGVAARATRIAQFLGDEAAVNQLVERWLTQEPDNPEAGRLAGIMALRRGAGAQAFDYFFEAAQEGMTVDFGMLARAYPQLPAQEQQNLKNRIDAKLDRQPMQSLVFARALMATEDQDDETALKIVDQLLEQNPEDLQALMLQARLRLNLEQPNALDALEQAVNKNPENAPLRHHFARLLSNSDPSKARSHYELLSADDPRNGEYLLSLALLNMELQDLLAAKAYLRQCLELGQLVDEAHYYMGEIEQQAGNAQAAVEHYRDVGESNYFLVANRRIAALLLQSEQYQSLSAFFALQRQKHPRRGEQLFALEAQALTSAGQDQQTKTILDQAIGLYPNSESLIYARAMAAQRLGNLEQLEQDLRSILAMSPENATVLNALGYTLADETDRYSEARELIETALRLAPDEPAILDSMGWVLYKLGQLDEAKRYLQRAYELMRDPEIAAHLGEVLLALGESEAATQIWEEAMHESPDHESLVATVERLKPNLLNVINAH